MADVETTLRPNVFVFIDFMFIFDALSSDGSWRY